MLNSSRLCVWACCPRGEGVGRPGDLTPSGGHRTPGLTPQGVGPHASGREASHPGSRDGDPPTPQIGTLSIKRRYIFENEGNGVTFWLM